jgi:hypothetical protein
MALAYIVVITAYLRLRLLCQTLEHLMPQVGPDIEVIVAEQSQTWTSQGSSGRRTETTLSRPSIGRRLPV